MQNLISSIDPVIAIYVVVTALCGIVTYIALKLHVPDHPDHPIHMRRR
jgi:hypothetical protein